MSQDAWSVSHYASVSVHVSSLHSLGVSTGRSKVVEISNAFCLKAFASGLVKSCPSCLYFCLLAPLILLPWLKL